MNKMVAALVVESNSNKTPSRSNQPNDKEVPAVGMNTKGEDKPPPVEQALQVIDMTDIKEEQESTTPPEREYNKRI